MPAGTCLDLLQTVGIMILHVNVSMYMRGAGAAVLKRFMTQGGRHRGCLQFGFRRDLLRRCITVSIWCAPARLNWLALCETSSCMTTYMTKPLRSRTWRTCVDSDCDMDPRGDDIGQLRADSELGAADLYNPLHLPWQTLSALATETGHAFRQTFTASGVGTGGHVQQVSQYRTSPNGIRNADEPDETLLVSDQVSTVQSEASSPTPASAHLNAVQEDMSRVARKMLTTDASTEVILRFNFMSARESRV